MTVAQISYVTKNVAKTYASLKAYFPENILEAYFWQLIKAFPFYQSCLCEVQWNLKWNALWELCFNNQIHFSQYTQKWKFWYHWNPVEILHLNYLSFFIFKAIELYTEYSGKTLDALRQADFDHITLYPSWISYTDQNVTPILNQSNFFLTQSRLLLKRLL